MTDKPQIIQVLEDAQLAHQAGDFVNALSFYQYFFDHALDDDPYALYGVRLSHCLKGWADLATVFPGAKNALEDKKTDMLNSYHETKNPEHFHDYVSICRYLNCQNEALDTFIQLHHAQPKSALKLTKFVWDDLLVAEKWSVCNDLLIEPVQKLDELFSIFDEANRLQQYDPAFNNAKFEAHIVDSLLNDLQNLVMVLRHANRVEDLATIERQFYQCAESRDHAALAKQIHAKNTFLFAGH